MRFILLEAMPQVSAADIKKWSTASDKVRGEIITRIIQGYGVNKDNPNWREGFRYACYQLGVDPKSNPFIEFMERVSNKGDIYLDNKILTALVDTYTKNGIDLSAEYFLNRSLYDRSPEEFSYTVNILDTVSNPVKISNFFKNTENIKVDDLFLDNGDIKPAGSISTADDLDTIFGTVESWSGSEGENEVTAKVNKKDPGNIVLTKEMKDRAEKIKGGFGDFPEEKKADGVIAYFEVPTNGKATIDDWTNSWNPGYYIYDASNKRWTRVKRQ